MTAVLLLVGCSPHDATLTGNYAVFMDEKNSETLQRLESTSTESLADRASELGLDPVDCRELEDSEEATRVPGAPACGETSPEWFTWLDQYGFYKNTGKINAEGDGAPWRTEALITQEGGLQLTAHIDVDGLGDMRFGWVIDPNFQPASCADAEGGGSEMVEYDGDWLGNWSEGQEGTLWHLTGGAYQLNPSDAEDYWYFPREWSTGVAFGRFSDEPFYGQPISYVDPNSVSLYFPQYEALSAETGGPWFPLESTYEEWLTSIDTTLNESTELVDLGGVAELDPAFVIEDNRWRNSDEDTTDDGSAGMEDWVGVSASWVRIDNPDAIMVDNTTPVTGEFQVYLRAANAGSAMLVRAEFSIDHIGADDWGYEPSLEEQKELENDTPDCGEDRLNFTEGEQ